MFCPPFTFSEPSDIQKLIFSASDSYHPLKCAFIEITFHDCFTDIYVQSVHQNSFIPAGSSHYYLIKRPGVAGAVLQTPS